MFMLATKFFLLAGAGRVIYSVFIAGNSRPVLEGNEHVKTKPVVVHEHSPSRVPLDLTLSNKHTVQSQSMWQTIRPPDSQHRSTLKLCTVTAALNMAIPVMRFTYLILYPLFWKNERTWWPCCGWHILSLTKDIVHWAVSQKLGGTLLSSQQTATFLTWKVIS